MSISEQEIKHLASLARLDIEQQDIQSFATKLSSIVDMANEISNLDTEQIQPTAHILENTNVFRVDEPVASYNREDILSNAPTKESGCISVPRVVE